ncbi:MAG TPA: N-6 DNA methylase [Planktothrix sp.]|jgi:SAM-dependent methyltransferase
MSHGAQLNRASALLRQIRALAPTRPDWASASDLLALLAMAQLVNAGLRPSALPVGDLFFGSRVAKTDSTLFGNALTRLAGRCPADALSAEIIAIALSAKYAELVSDPCMLGWLYQILLREESADLRRGKEEIEPARIAAATQWFTPEWVARYLVEETVGTGRSPLRDREFCTVLDPACGAGHLLVELLKQLACSNESIESALKYSIYGLDIDPFMIELAGFALYLECRKLSATIADFSLPNLYIVADDASIGSLWLGTNEPQRLLSRSPFSDSTGKLPGTFDAIVANPPYLSHRMMPPPISEFLKTHYPASQYDLYAAFFSMGIKLLAPGGRLAMICQQSFLSIQRYRQLRAEMIEQCRLESVAQLGPGAFAAKAGEKVNNAIVVLSKKISGTEGGGAIRFWRLLDDGDKERAETLGLSNLPATEVESDYITTLLQSVENAPIALWSPREINSLFSNCEPMQNGKNGIVCTNGLFTCDNQRFVKRFAEVCEHERHEYVSYDKGGGHKWYRTTPLMLHWRKNGNEIRQFRKSRGQAYALPGEEHYFKVGVTYSYIGTRGFKARMLSPDSIFDIASSAVFSDSLDHVYMLGFLNSALACFMLGVLNPTINFQIGDLRRLPFVVPSDRVQQEIASLVQRAISLARVVESFDPDSPVWSRNVLPDPESETAHYREYLRIIDELNSEERTIQQSINATIFDLYGISEATRDLVLKDPWVVRSHGDLCKPLSLQKCRAVAGEVPRKMEASRR